MPTSKILNSLGIYAVEEFFKQSECKQLCSEMNASAKSQARTYTQSENLEKVDHQVRKTQYCKIADTSHTSIMTKIKGIRSDLEHFFGAELADKFEPPKYLRYGEGDFFAPHTDGQLNRKINISININSTDPAQSDLVYAGGQLQFYGLIKQKGFADRAISAPCDAGTLLAYPVDVIHEVTPVLKGARFSIVSRFLAG